MKESKRYNSEGVEVVKPGGYDEWTTSISDRWNEFQHLSFGRYDQSKTLKEWIELAEDRGSIISGLEEVVRGGNKLLDHQENQLKSKDKEIEELNKKLDEQTEEIRYHPETLEPVEKPEEPIYCCSGSAQSACGCMGMPVNLHPEEVSLWNNALTLEQVFEKYKELEKELQRLREGIESTKKRFSRGVEIHDKQMNDTKLSPIEQNRNSYLKYQAESIVEALNELLTTSKEG